MATILVVDDDRFVRGTIRPILEAMGHDIVEAQNGDEGLRLFADTDFDLALVDIVMPIKNGIDTIVAMRQTRPFARIMAISGGGRRGMTQLLEIAEHLGADAALAKPFTSTELIVKVEAQLACTFG